MGTHGAVASGHRDLYAEFRIDLNGGCPVSTLDKPIEEIRVQVEDGTCHADLVIGGSRRHVEHMNLPIGRECVGTVFASFGCVPNVLSLQDSTMFVGAFLPGLKVLPSIIDEVAAICDGVHITRLVSIEADRCAPVMVDMSALSEKERETLRLAVESGYFEGPDVSLSDLSNALGLTEGAVSRRIKSAKGALLSQFCPGSADD